MAKDVRRSRNIKPGICSSETLIGTSIPERLVFSWLPMFADVEGRLLDRPVRLKALMFPYDEGITAKDVDNWLWGLAGLSEASGEPAAIVRYTDANGEDYIQIVNFLEHQNPHKREKALGSEIPPYQPGECKLRGPQSRANTGTHSPYLGGPQSLRTQGPQSLDAGPQSQQEEGPQSLRDSGPQSPNTVQTAKSEPQYTSGRDQSGPKSGPVGLDSLIPGFPDSLIQPGLSTKNRVGSAAKFPRSIYDEKREKRASGELTSVSSVLGKLEMQSGQSLEQRLRHQVTDWASWGPWYRWACTHPELQIECHELIQRIEDAADEHIRQTKGCGEFECPGRWFVASVRDIAKSRGIRIPSLDSLKVAK